MMCWSSVLANAVMLLLHSYFQATDPFSRKELKLEMVLDNSGLKQKIKAWRAAKQQQRSQKQDDNS